MNKRKVLVTGGAGYIGSLLCGELLSGGFKVIALDNLLFGGNSLLAYLTHPDFSFAKADVCDKDRIRAFFAGVDNIVHLAAVVGFPACERAGPEKAFKVNLQGTKNVFELAEEHGVERFIFTSTYSNYGKSEGGLAVTEDSPLYPQSLYAQTKIAAEEYLIARGRRSTCAPVVLRLATLFGPSPRTRFDLIINQFVLEAIERRKIVLYEKDFCRSFVHIRDATRAVQLCLDAPEKKIRSEVFNVGSNSGNYSKEEIVSLIRKYVAGFACEYKEMSLEGDMRDIKVSFDKIERVLGFETKISVEEGIRDFAAALQTGFLRKGP
jgi:nucleoside-diphosphate-sugar epimerase